MDSKIGGDFEKLYNNKQCTSFLCTGYLTFKEWNDNGAKERKVKFRKFPYLRILFVKNEKFLYRSAFFTRFL